MVALRALLVMYHKWWVPLSQRPYPRPCLCQPAAARPFLTLLSIATRAVLPLSPLLQARHRVLRARVP